MVNRGPTFADGKLFFNTFDGHTIAVDAETGQEVWKTCLSDINRGETMTMAPFVAGDKVCMDWEGTEANYIAGTPYLGVEARMKAGPGGHRGDFTAWDVRNAREAWTINETFPVWGGALATAGDVVFYGTMEGWFKVVHARTGQEL